MDLPRCASVVGLLALSACFNPEDMVGLTETDTAAAGSSGTTGTLTSGISQGTNTDSMSGSTTNPTSSSSTAADSASTTETSGSTCGDGVTDLGEDCDDGEQNSDEDADACRTDCTLAGCGDGVVDSGEDCDDGADNSDEAPDACRTSCDNPSCGDGAVDSDEVCDDGNEAWGDSCYACIERYYFVLNSPSTNSSGDDSVVRVSREGESLVLVEPNIEYNGSREIEVEPDGSALYVMQSNFGLVQQRVIVFDAETGVQTDEFDVGETTLGYPASPAAMTRGINGLLYLLIRDGSTDVHVVTVDPSNGSVNEDFAFGFSVGIGDMTTDDSGSYFFTNPFGNEVWRASPASNTVNLVADSDDGLNSPFGITYWAAGDEIWLANNSAPEVYRLGDFGNAISLMGVNPVQKRGLFMEDDGTPVVPLGDADVVVEVAPDGTATTLFDEELNFPLDIKVVDFSG